MLRVISVEILADACGRDLQPARSTDRHIRDHTSDHLVEAHADFLVPQSDGGWLHGSSSMAGGDIYGSYDSALVMLDGLAQPLLDPFVEGLKVRMLPYGPSAL